MSAAGYCHFNSSDSNTSFKIDIFGADLLLWQDPGSRDLGHGAVVWDSSVVLVKHMEHAPKDFDRSKLCGKKVLELGSGCGLAGISFMLKGAAVTFTDLEKIVAQLTDRNVRNAYSQMRMNQPHLEFQEPHVFAIDWTDSLVIENFCNQYSATCSAVFAKVDINAAEAESTEVNRKQRENAAVDPLVEQDTEQASLRDAAAPSSSLSLTLPEQSTATATATAVTTAATSAVTAVARAAATTTGAMRSLPRWQDALSPPYDIILLTDCVFSPALTQDLVRIIKCCCGPRSTVICCHEIRDEEANDLFLKHLAEHFTYKSVPNSKLHPEYCNDQVHIIIAKPLKTRKEKATPHSV